MSDANLFQMIEKSEDVMSTHSTKTEFTTYLLLLLWSTY